MTYCVVNELVNSEDTVVEAEASAMPLNPTETPTVALTPITDTSVGRSRHQKRTVYQT